MNLKWGLPLSLFLLLFSFLWWYTLGFSSFTVFSYTLKKAGIPPYRVPEINLLCHNKAKLNLGKIKGTVFVNFIYLNCYYGCPISFARMYFLRNKLSEETLFVSVTVDPERDDLRALRDRWEGLGSYDNWLFCKPLDSDWKKRLIKLGVWVYKRKDGLINHTLDIFLIKDSLVQKTISPNQNVEKILKEVL